MMNNKQRFKDIVKKTEDKKDKLGRALIAFFSGGIVALIGQSFFDIYSKIFEINDKDSISFSQSVEAASLGIFRSPLGERATEPTLTPSGIQLLLNC